MSNYGYKHLFTKERQISFEIRLPFVESTNIELVGKPTL